MSLLTPGTAIMVIQHKFDGAVYRRLPKRVLRAHTDSLVLEGAPGDTVSSPTGSWTTTYFDIAHNWFDRWFNVIEFYKRDGAFEFYYVNIQQPIALNGTALDLIDLDLDVWVKPDLSWELLDQDEFDVHRIKYGYSSELIAQIYATLEHVKTLIAGETFPFRRNVMTFAQERARLLARPDLTE